MTVPVFLQTDETAFDDARALTAEHGRRLVRNALAIWNERCGTVGHAEQLIAEDGTDLSTRTLITAGWAYLGPWHYYCPSPVGTPNQARPVPTVRLMMTGRATGSATSYLYIVNQTLGAPTEGQMDGDVTGSGDAWAEITDTDWSVTLTVRVSAGWNRLWLAVKCGQYGTPTSLIVVDGADTYNPYASIYTSLLTTNSSHPAILSPSGTRADAPAQALILATLEAAYTAGQTVTYTVPMVIRNPTTTDLQDGMRLLWEPFSADFSRLRPVIGTDVPGWLNPAPTAAPVTGYSVDLDVLNLDSVTVDGSQVWETEDYSEGAGLRWWQLPSASQYRNAAQLAEIARRAVCPMVSMVNEVRRGLSSVPYPLGTTGGKTQTWSTSDGDGSIQAALLSLSELPPFALPADTVSLELKIPVAVMLLNFGRRLTTVSLTCTLTIFDRSTSTVIATETREQVTSLLLPGAGSVDGYSVLARTLGWSEAFLDDDHARYGQEGLTLRADWNRWQDVTLAIAVDRSLLPVDPVLIRWNVAVDDSVPSDFLVAKGDAGVRIKGL